MGRANKTSVHKELIKLATQITTSKDAINNEERAVAFKIVADDFKNFSELNEIEIEDLISLIYMYWDAENELTTESVDTLLNYKHALDVKSRNHQVKLRKPE